MDALEYLTKCMTAGFEAGLGNPRAMDVAFGSVPTPSANAEQPLTFRIASVPCGASSAFLHPACVGDLTGVEYHDLTVTELLDQQIVTCDACGERILPKGVSRVQHTPGPWDCYIGEDGFTVFQTDGRGNGDHIMCVAGNGEAEANARLIAAAPELLEALKAVEQLITRDSDDLGFHLRVVPIRIQTATALREAIARAEGRA